MLVEEVSVILHELNAIKNRIRASLIYGDYDGLLEVAKDIIVLEVRAVNQGVYDQVEEAFMEVKQVYATAIMLLTATPRPRKPLLRGKGYGRLKPPPKR